jgi:hypothetical protein
MLMLYDFVSAHLFRENKAPGLQFQGFIYGGGEGWGVITPSRLVNQSYITEPP